MFLGYDILGGRLPSVEADDWNVEQRFRAGVQLDPIKNGALWSPPIRFEYASVFGPTDGFMLAAYVVYPIDIGGFPDAKD